jgi:adenylate cyclase, class 2
VASRARTIREVEIKLRIADMPALLRRLRGLGCRPGVRIFEQNVLYDTQESDFRRRGQLLRLRIETPAPDASPRHVSKAFRPGKSRAILTSKVPVVDVQPPRFKEKFETEVIVRDPGAWRRAMQRLGLREGFRYEKYRTSFRFGGAHLDLDETPVGVFLEIEGAALAIDRVSKRLGFAQHDFIRATYWDLYAADCRRKGRKTGNMLFDA